jgi:hypothetical protein
VLWKPQLLGDLAVWLPLNPFFALMETVRGPLVGAARRRWSGWRRWPTRRGLRDGLRLLRPLPRPHRLLGLRPAMAHIEADRLSIEFPLYHLARAVAEEAADGARGDAAEGGRATASSSPRCAT